MNRYIRTRYNSNFFEKCGLQSTDTNQDSFRSKSTTTKANIKYHPTPFSGPGHETILRVLPPHCPLTSRSCKNDTLGNIEMRR
jgi:hypothetical protein